MRAYAELEEQRELDRYNMPMRTQKDRGNVSRGKVLRSSRLPHVSFAATLEEVCRPSLDRHCFHRLLS
jgi:hypothetical protein